MVNSDGQQPPLQAIGLNSSKKAIKNGEAKKILLASDSDALITEQITAIAQEYGVEVSTQYSMEELGRFCGIAVSCAVCVLK